MPTLNYYKDQLNKIDFHSEYPPTLKIQGENSETHWLNLNKELAKVLVEILIREFKLEIK
jgi:hypothetical protein